MQKNPAGAFQAPAGLLFWYHSGLSVLAVEDLGGRLDEQHSTHHGQESLRQHVAGIVPEAVGPCAQALIQVAPDEDAGQKAAHKAQEACNSRTDGHADHPVLEGAGKELCRAQRHERHQIVQQDLAEEIEEGGRRGCPEAQKHLQAAVHQTGEQTPLDTVAEGDEHKGQHTQQSDAAAVGHSENFDVGQHGADGDHQRALHQHPGLGVRFRHEDSSSHNNSTQKQNAPAFLAGARAVCENRDLSANYLRRHYPDQVQGSLPTADLSLTAPLFSCPLSV